jgi:hypothetical protein
MSHPCDIASQGETGARRVRLLRRSIRYNADLGFCAPIRPKRAVIHEKSTNVEIACSGGLFEFREGFFF